MGRLRAVIAGMVLGVFVSVTITHIHLWRMLASRGDRKWRLRSTLASIPLIMLGSAGVGGVLGWVPYVDSTSTVFVMSLVVCAVVVVVALFVLLLGVLALRKFNA